MQIANFRDTGSQALVRATPVKARNLLAACLAHALHDGYTDGLYAFLPVWQAQFGLSYAGLAVVRALYYATMGGLQMPSDKLSRGLSPRAALSVSTLIAAVGFLIIALPFGFAGLCVGLVIAGLGSSIQHPRGSLLVSDIYGKASRAPLGIYNFSGDLGKAILPAVAALLLPILAWRPVIGMMNGTSSVLYGTVPELSPNGNVGRAFAIFYTSVIGSGGLAPIVYGAVADHSTQTIGIVAAAGTAIMIIPLVIAMRPYLRPSN